MTNSIISVLANTALLGLMLSLQSPGQDKGTQIVFHVTAVRSEEAHDWCTTGECSATRFTVEGYSDVKRDAVLTEYVLDCVEVITQKPSPHHTVTCARVHAHNDYDAKLFADGVAFGQATSESADGPIAAAYKIVSEKESQRGHKP